MIGKLRQDSIFYRDCSRQMGATSSIPRNEVASMAYANGRQAKYIGLRREVEATGIVGMAFATVSLLALIFLLGPVPLVAIGLLGHLALILGIASILRTYRHRGRFRLKAFGILSLGLGYIIAVVSMLILLL